MNETNDAIENILSYWFGRPAETAAQLEEKKQLWFTGSEDIDREIRTKFGDLVVKARAGELASWTESPRGTLALMILLDQFCRNLYRGTPDAFTHDGICLEIVSRGFEDGFFAELDVIERMFVALPFRHAEDVQAQMRGVDLAVKDAMVGAEFQRDFLVYSVDWARKHLDVIVRFGRFPHRNKAMGRTSTPEEIEYLDYLKLVGQWL